MAARKAPLWACCLWLSFRCELSTRASISMAPAKMVMARMISKRLIPLGLALVDKGPALVLMGAHLVFPKDPAGDFFQPAGGIAGIGRLDDELALEALVARMGLAGMGQGS